MARSPVARLATVTLALALSACGGGTGAGGHESVATSATALPGATTTTTVPATTSAPGTTTSAPGTSTPVGSTTNPATTPTTDPTVERPFEVVVPNGDDGSMALPLVILLHGYGITGAMQEDFFHLQRQADARGFLLAYPDGTVDADGKHFWNATDACCGFGNSTVDDSGYLAAMIQHIQADHRVDPARIFVVGFSNGGFMSYRMACDHADLIAAVVSISGATFLDRSMCNPTEPVSVVEIHGTLDEAIAYDGGTFRDLPHPGAVETVADWAAANGCTGAAATDPTGRDLERRIAGDEAVVTQYGGCPPDGAVELWTIPGGTHIPELSPTFTAQVIDFLLAHPKQ